MTDHETPGLDPRSEAMTAFTSAVFHAFDAMWAEQADPLRMFDLWRTGCGFFVVSAAGPQRMTIDFVRAGLDVVPAPAPPDDRDGPYL